MIGIGIYIFSFELVTCLMKNSDFTKPQQLKMSTQQLKTLKNKRKYRVWFFAFPKKWSFHLLQAWHRENHPETRSQNPWKLHLPRRLPHQSQLMLLHIHYLQHPRSVVNFSSPMGWLNNIHSKMEISKNTANHMRSESQQISSTSGVWLFLEFGVQFSCAYPTPPRWI